MLNNIIQNIGQEDSQYKYILKLCKPNETVVCFIPFISLTLTRRFNDYDDLSFSIADTIYTAYNHSYIDNPVWDEVKTGYTVLLEAWQSNSAEPVFEEFFSIEIPDIQGGTDGEHTKIFTCTPTHQTLFNRMKLRGFDDTRKLYDFDLSSYESGSDEYPLSYVYSLKSDTTGDTENTLYNPSIFTEGGILNYVLNYILNQNITIDDKTAVTVISSSDDYYKQTMDSLDNDKLWKVTYYDTLLNTAYTEALENQGVEIPSKSAIYTFFLGSIVTEVLNAYDEDSDSFSTEIDTARFTGEFTTVTSGLGTYIKSSLFTNGFESSADISYTYSDTNISGDNYWTLDKIYAYILSIVPKNETQLEDQDTYLPFISLTGAYDFMAMIQILMDSSATTSDNGYGFNTYGERAADLGYDSSTVCLSDLAELYYPSWIARFMLDPIYLTERITQIESQLKFLQTIMDFLIEQAQGSVVNAEETEAGTTDKTGLNNDLFNACYQLLSDLYSEVLYRVWYPLYKKFSVMQGRMPYRQMQYDETNLTDLFQSLEDEFSCIFDFDNVKKEIKIYSRENEVFDYDTNLILNPYNYIKDITINETNDQIVTRAYLTGKDDLWITGVNPTGQRYIDDFSKFLVSTDNTMSDELKAALAEYSEILEYATTEKVYTVEYDRLTSYDSTNGTSYKTISVSCTFNQLVQSVEQLTENLSNVTLLYKDWKKIDQNERLLDDNGDTGQTAESLYILRTSIEEQLSQYLNSSNFGGSGSGVPYEYEAYKERVQAYSDTLTNAQISLLYSKVEDNDGNKIFDQSLLFELNNFIYEEDVTLNSVSDALTLYNYGKDYITYKNTIPIDVSINLIDILSVPTYQQDWCLVQTVGQKCQVYYPKVTSEIMQFTIMEYTHKYSSSEQDLSIRLSNSEDLLDLKYRLELNTWASAYKVAKDVEKYRSSWEDYLRKKDVIIEQGQSINAATNPIVTSKGTKIINDNGIVLSSLNGNTIMNYPDGLYCAGGGGGEIATISGGTLTQSSTSSGYTYSYSGGTTGNSIAAIDVGRGFNLTEENILTSKIHIINTIPSDDELIVGDLYFYSADIPDELVDE